uniref:Splicing factor Cactin n=1 Tax=Fagus sylvatica TaxID=28930 RepID=A0A2N9F969_FAGSY
MAMLARERARAEFHDWEKKEKEFFFNQSKIGSEIRLREGRLKPIDILSKHLNGSDDFDMEMNEPPYSVFKGLTVKEMAKLLDDIKLHMDLDSATPIHKEGFKRPWTSNPSPPEDNFKLKAMKVMGAMEDGDAVFGFGSEVKLDSQVYYWWHDKYRPRKPKYFNRVHTGYEWNKYNRVHFDHDNPPPKFVQ